ncbi:MAG: hypothetical protein KAS32_22755 [Candidatus Peribacteraceae bacterium]|nr:hypothetical protein [Candidatus Peribacteraceae bacterium]
MSVLKILSLGIIAGVFLIGSSVISWGNTLIIKSDLSRYAGKRNVDDWSYHSNPAGTPLPKPNAIYEDSSYTEQAYRKPKHPKEDNENYDSRLKRKPKPIEEAPKIPDNNKIKIPGKNTDQ